MTLLSCECSTMFRPRQVEVACPLLMSLLVTSSASWIFPDRKQPARNSRDDEGVQEDLKILSLVSGQPSSVATHHGLLLLRHLLQAQRNNSKVPRSLDIHTRLINPPSGLSSSHGGLVSPQLTISHDTRSCCTGSGFKPSTYFSPTAPKTGDVAAYKPSITTTHKPIQTYNAINIYKPIFNSHVITTHKPVLTYSNATIPPYQYTRTTTANPTHAYNSVFLTTVVTTNKPTHNIYYDTTVSSYKDAPAVTTYRPKYNHNHIPNYVSSANKYKATSTATSQVSTNKRQHLPQRDQHSTNTFKPKRQVIIYTYQLRQSTMSSPS